MKYESLCDNAIKVMALNVFDTHDKLLDLRKKMPEILSQGCEDCLKKNPDSLFYQECCPYIYIFAHPRLLDDGTGHRLLWQPRLIRPNPEPNSYCFRAISKKDIIEVCWILPSMELWGQHQQGNVTEYPEIQQYISMYLHNRKELKRPHPQDISEERAKNILIKLAKTKEEIKRKKDSMPLISVESLIS